MLLQWFVLVVRDYELARVRACGLAWLLGFGCAMSGASTLDFKTTAEMDSGLQ